MNKLSDIFWESVPKSWCNVDQGAVKGFREEKTVGRDRERYSDEL